MALMIDNRQKYIPLNKKLIQLMEKAISECLITEGWSDGYEVSLSFVEKEEMQQLNKMYRHKDYVTDVLSFPMAESCNPEVPDKTLGDIVICAERALEQAQEYKHSFDREIVFLTVHSMFHLMGYDHQSQEETKIMRQKEELIMNKLDLRRD